MKFSKKNEKQTISFNLVRFTVFECLSNALVEETFFKKDRLLNVIY